MIHWSISLIFTVTLVLPSLFLYELSSLTTCTYRYILCYTLSQDIYATHFLKSFDIYKYLRVKHCSFNIMKKRVFFSKTPSSFSGFITRLKINVYGDFALQARLTYPDDGFEKLCEVFWVTYEWGKDVNISHYYHRKKF